MTTCNYVSSFLGWSVIVKELELWSLCILLCHHSWKICNMLKGSCLINHEKIYIIYVDSLYKISATDSHLLKILTIINCRYAFYQSLKDNRSTYILCSKSAILVNALLINIVLWKAKSYPLLPFFSVAAVESGKTFAFLDLNFAKALDSSPKSNECEIVPLVFRLWML